MLKSESRNAQKLHRAREFNYKKIKETYAKYIDPRTGKYANKYTERRCCPVCDSKRETKLFESSGGTYVRCDDCGMVFLNPVFTETALGEFYKQLNAGQAAIVSNETDFYREIYGSGLDAIERHVRPGRLLDLGCSSGFFLDLARVRGWETYGVELGLAEAELCKKKNHVLFTQDVEKVDWKVKFDAITLWDVFEHLPHGKHRLDFLKKMLNPQGLIFIQSPNAGGLAPRIMHETCKMFDGLEHVNMYDPKTIRLIAEKCGMAVIELKTVISEIAVTNNHLSYVDPYFGTGDFNGSLLLGLLDARFIHDNLLGYKIQVVLKAS